MPIRTLREVCLQVMRGKLNQWALDTSVSIVTKIQARRPGRSRSVLAGARNLSLLQSKKKKKCLWGPKKLSIHRGPCSVFSRMENFQ